MLTTEDKELIEYAKNVIDKNYDDVNWWHTVGAAVRTKNGNIYVGVNCDSVSHGSCAEVIAMGAAISAGEREFDTIVAILGGKETPFEKYMSQWPEKYQVDTIDMIDGTWREKIFSGYDAVYHVAGIAHSDNGKISEEKKKLYYAVNTDLTVETAKKAKADGVKQFIFMSSASFYKW